MFVDTHCHLNIMIKKDFDRLLTHEELRAASPIIDDANKHDITVLINVGTSLPESINCVELARAFSHIYATVGIHPNDLTPNWHDDFKQLKQYVTDPRNKIVGIGETGVDRHYPGYDLQRQYDGFKAQIELALEYNLGLVVHSRDAYDETLFILDQYANEPLRAIIHCFSEDQAFADHVIKQGFVLGIGGTITYPKNEVLRAVCASTSLEHIVLETDAPFLPPQYMRGKQNSPAQIAYIAQYLADIKQTSIDEVARVTTKNALRVFGLESII